MPAGSWQEVDSCKRLLCPSALPAPSHCEKACPCPRHSRTESPCKAEGPATLRVALACHMGRGPFAPDAAHGLSPALICPITTPFSGPLDQGWQEQQDASGPPPSSGIQTDEGSPFPPLLSSCCMCTATPASPSASLLCLSCAIGDSRLTRPVGNYPAVQYCNSESQAQHCVFT